jgi:hypothetical protein
MTAFKKKRFTGTLLSDALSNIKHFLTLGNFGCFNFKILAIQLFLQNPLLVMGGVNKTNAYNIKTKNISTDTGKMNAYATLRIQLLIILFIGLDLKI